MPLVYDSALRRVVARVEARFRDLVLEERLADHPPAEEAATILSREVRRAAACSKIGTMRWSNGFCASIVCAHGCRNSSCRRSDEDDRSAIVEHICHGAFSYNEIKDRPVLPVVKSWLSRQQQAWVEEYAPERIQLPRGRNVKVVYSIDGAPTMAARIQDLYDIKDGCGSPTAASRCAFKCWHRAIVQCR